MGNDGGSIPDRRDLVKSKPKAEQADKANQTRARWLFCALSKRPLQEPVVSCALGKLYNKDAIIEYLLDKSAYGDGGDICGHIRSLKDVKTLKLTPNTTKASSGSEASSGRAPFVCPLTIKEMNGSQPFVYLWTCGCVFSHSGLRALAGTPPPREDSGKLEKKEQKDNEPAVQLEMCPQCGAKYHKTEDVLLLNPSPEDESKMFETMIMRRASEPVKTKGKKRKAAAVDADTAQPAAKKSHASGAPSINPNIASASRAVANSLAQEEAKRKANMSDAVKSLYEPKAGSKKNETFMTRGTFTRYA